MSETRNFYAPNLNLDSLVQALKDWYRAQGFNVQMLDRGGSVLVRCSQKEPWRNLVGMSFTIEVLLRHNGAELIVEIGASKWIDKVVVGIVSIFLIRYLGILALAAACSAGYGAWKQNNLPKRTFEFIQQFLSTGESQSSWEMLPPRIDDTVIDPKVSYQFCSNCGESVPESARFCSKCGQKLF